MRKYGYSALVALGLGGFCAQNAMALNLSLATATDMIVAESQDLKKADANLQKAQAQLSAVNANRWFKLDASATYMNMIDVERPFQSSHFDLPPALGGLIPEAMRDKAASFEMPDNILMVGLSASQPIYTFGKIGNAVKSVKSAIEISKSSQELTRRAVRYGAAEIYWTAKMTDDIVKIAKSDLQAARDARRNLTASARANRSNLVKIESDIATKEINLSDAEFNRDTAHRMLKILAGIDVDEKLVLTDEFPTTFADVQAGRLTRNPQWDILGAQAAMYESQARAARAEHLPTLAAMASYNFVATGAEYDTMFDKSGSQSAYWGLALQMPIFAGGATRANATISAMDAEAVRQDLDKSKKMITEEYDNAVKKYDHLRGNLKSLQNARDLAAKTYEFSRQRFAAGQTSAIELAEVSAGLYQLDMALMNAKYNILMSAAAIEKLGE